MHAIPLHLKYLSGGSTLKNAFKDKDKKMGLPVSLSRPPPSLALQQNLFR